jgi:hypothetical protein
LLRPMNDSVPLGAAASLSFKALNPAALDIGKGTMDAGFSSFQVNEERSIESIWAPISRARSSMNESYGICFMKVSGPRRSISGFGLDFPREVAAGAGERM